MMRNLLGILVVSMLALGCSAIISPDSERLGAGPDGDASLPPPDTGMFDGTILGDGTISGDSAVDAGEPDVGPPDAGDPDGDVPDGDIPCADRCNDSVDCTMDECADDGSCIFTPTDELCADGERCNPEMGCVPTICTEDAECSDGLYCNGEETCDPMAEEANPATGCLNGEDIACDDGLDCTNDTCDEDMDICDYAADDTICDDTIDCTTDRCDTDRGCVHDPDDTMCDSTWCRVGGTCNATSGCVGGSERDCGDSDACTSDTCDEMMMMCIHEARDEDGDGHGAERVWDRGWRDCMGGDDCNDGNPDIHPGATEYCNGRNDDCDGMTDEGCTSIPDTCATAAAISIPAGGGTWRSSGNLGVYSRNFNTYCDSGRGSGPDAVYYLDVTALSDISISTVGSSADTVLAVDDRCATGGSGTSFRFACNDDLQYGDTDSRMWVHRFGPAAGDTTRRLWILVQGYSSSSTGDFSIEVSVRRAAVDSCAMGLDISGGGSVWGTVTTGTSTLSGTCGGMASARQAEGVFTFNGPSDGTGTFRGYSRDFDPHIYVRQSPCATGMERGCDESSGWSDMERAALDRVTLPAGTRYYGVIDGADNGDEYWFSYTP